MAPYVIFWSQPAKILQERILPGRRRNLKKLTHFNPRGQAHMVDVGAKDETHRVARAGGRIVMQRATLAMIAAGSRK